MNCRFDEILYRYMVAEPKNHEFNRACALVACGCEVCSPLTAEEERICKPRIPRAQRPKRDSNAIQKFLGMTYPDWLAQPPKWRAHQSNLWRGAVNLGYTNKEEWLARKEKA